MKPYTYATLTANLTAVFLSGKRVGTILRLFDGWFQYRPKGPSGAGDVWTPKFNTIEGCKQSLEAQ